MLNDEFSECDEAFRVQISHFRIYIPLGMAERVGFEPTEPLPVHVLSRHADSSTLAPLRPVRIC
jgi:hypothetical protein